MITIIIILINIIYDIRILDIFSYTTKVTQVAGTTLYQSINKH